MDCWHVTHLFVSLLNWWEPVRLWMNGRVDDYRMNEGTLERVTYRVNACLLEEDDNEEMYVRVCACTSECNNHEWSWITRDSGKGPRGPCMNLWQLTAGAEALGTGMYKNQAAPKTASQSQENQTDDQPKTTGDLLHDSSSCPAPLPKDTTPLSLQVQRVMSAGASPAGRVPSLLALL